MFEENDYKSLDNSDLSSGILGERESIAHVSVSHTSRRAKKEWRILSVRRRLGRKSTSVAADCQSNASRPFEVHVARRSAHTLTHLKVFWRSNEHVF